MIATILNFINMGGYAFYVWLAYGSVLIILFIQWWLPWRRWKKYLKSKQQLNNE